MSNDIIQICYEQKLLFMNKLLSITQKMLAVSGSDDMDDFKTLLQERAVCLQRINKCEVLLKKTVSELSEDERTIYEHLFSGSLCAEDFPSDCLQTFSLHNEFRSVLRQTCDVNEQVETCLRLKREELIRTSPLKKSRKALLHK